MKQLKAFIAKLWRTIFNLESAVERFVRASLGVLGVSGLAFAHQVAAEVGMPKLVRAIQLASLGAMFLSWVIAAGQKNPPAPPPTSPPPAV